MADTERARRTVLVTGAASGMGQAIARRFLTAGDRVVLGDIDAGRLAATVEALGGRAAHAFGVVADVTNVTACAGLVAAAIDAGGGLDVVVNSAGVWVEGASAEAVESEWDVTLGVNLKGPFFVCRHAIPALVRSGGSIINIASDAGLVGNAGAAIYSASKGGLVLLTKSLALELAPHGVRVNAVCPCDVATPMIDFQADTYGNGDPEAYKAALLAHYPQRARARFARADEIAELVYYLASAAAQPITGAALPIDFGLTAGY